MKLLEPAKPLGTIDTIFELDCVADKETRQKHVDRACARGLPICVNRKERSGKVAVVGSGPSATECVDLLKEWDGEIWGINGAFEWMIHRGIKPTAFVALDPDPDENILKDYLITTPNDATYYLGAMCHPAVFDRLEGKNVRIWFPIDGEAQFPFGAVPVHGGSTCLGRAPNLAYVLGWREVHIMGGDSSYTHKSHVYGNAGYPPGAFPVEMNGKLYITNRQMMQQACDFAEQMVEWARPGPKGETPLSVTLYGDGLMQATYAHQLKAGVYQQYLYELALERKGMNRKQRRAMR